MNETVKKITRLIGFKTQSFKNTINYTRA